MSQYMQPGELIKRIDGLSRDRLNYFVKEGYVKSRKKERGKLTYNDFSIKEFEVLKKAMEDINAHDTRYKTAFDKARKELNP